MTALAIDTVAAAAPFATSAAPVAPAATPAATPSASAPVLVASGAVTGAPRLVLRAEALLVLVLAVVAYGHVSGQWGLFALLFLAPDVSLFGYLAGPRIGATAYNAAHSYLGPGALALAGLAMPALLPFAAIWVAHVGFDRALGYGLKYSSAFADTHLGRIGRAARAR